MVQTNPFSAEKLNQIFNISQGDYPRLLSRESGTLEFKQSFGWGSFAKYMKTCAAYANTVGASALWPHPVRLHRPLVA